LEHPDLFNRFKKGLPWTGVVQAAQPFALTGIL